MFIALALGFFFLSRVRRFFSRSFASVCFGFVTCFPSLVPVSGSFFYVAHYFGFFVVILSLVLSCVVVVFAVISSYLLLGSFSLAFFTFFFGFLVIGFSCLRAPSFSSHLFHILFICFCV